MGRAKTMKYMYVVAWYNSMSKTMARKINDRLYFTFRRDNQKKLF